MDATINALGIDLTDEYVQISYVKSGESKAESLSISPEEQKYLIPSLLYYREENDTWYAGEEALFNSSGDRSRCLTFDGHIKYSEEHMSRFVKLLIELTERLTGLECTGIICVTEEDCDLDSIRCIYSSFSNLGYDDERIRVINHDEAFIYYTINQKKELWVNDVVLFDFTRKHFKYRRLHEVKRITPPALVVTQEDISRDISYGMLETEAGRRMADRKLLDYIQTEFRQHIICTAFLTGTGFYEEWAEESVGEICNRRRAFQGYNLFVKGACYAALKKFEGNLPKNHIFQCSGRTKADIGLLINNEGKNMVISLSSAGDNWYEAGAEAECILDDVTRINLVAVLAMDGSRQNLTIDLGSFPKRPNKTTRIRITLGYKNDDVFEVIVKDMGFGELFASSGMTVKKTVSVSELFIL